MGILLPKLTLEEIDELVSEFIFHLVYCGIENKEDLSLEQQSDYEKWEKNQMQQIL